MKNILSELAIVCFFAAAVFACFMGMAATPVAHLVFGLAALVTVSDWNGGASRSKKCMP